MQYAVSDAITGDITVQEVPFSEDTLDSDDVFLIDCVNHLYVWIGSGATAQEKEQSMIIAEEFLRMMHSIPGCGRMWILFLFHTYTLDFSNSAHVY